VNAKGTALDGCWTPLHGAAWEGHAEVAEILIKAGAYLNTKDEQGKTPHDIAIDSKNWNAAQIIEAAMR